jgi:hypothetical protein
MIKGLQVKNLSAGREKAQQRIWKPESSYILPYLDTFAFIVLEFNE